MSPVLLSSACSSDELAVVHMQVSGIKAPHMHLAICLFPVWFISNSQFWLELNLSDVDV